MRSNQWKTYPFVVSHSKYAKINVKARSFDEAWRKAEERAELGDFETSGEWGFEVVDVLDPLTTGNPDQ